MFRSAVCAATIGGLLLFARENCPAHPLNAELFLDTSLFAEVERERRK